MRSAWRSVSAWKMDSEIMAETNCTVPCSYYEYETKPMSLGVMSAIPKDWIFPNDTVAAIQLFYVDSATYVSVEYWTYDGWSFFGEVGGAVGVFLGLSLLNVYQMVVRFVTGRLATSEKDKNGWN